MLPDGAVPGSFIGLHRVTASLSGRGEFDRLKFSFSWSGGLLVSTSFGNVLSLPSNPVT